MRDPYPHWYFEMPYYLLCLLMGPEFLEFFVRKAKYSSHIQKYLKTPKLMLKTFSATVASLCSDVGYAAHDNCLSRPDQFWLILHILLRKNML